MLVALSSWHRESTNPVHLLNVEQRQAAAALNQVNLNLQTFRTLTFSYPGVLVHLEHKERIWWLEMSFFPAGGANSGPPNPYWISGATWTRKERKKKGRERKGTGENTLS